MSMVIDRRKAKIRVDYLRMMLDNLRLLNRDGNDKWVLETFGVTKRQAFENMFAGIERTMNDSLQEKEKKA